MHNLLGLIAEIQENSLNRCTSHDHYGCTNRIRKEFLARLSRLRQGGIGPDNLLTLIGQRLQDVQGCAQILEPNPKALKNGEVGLGPSERRRDASVIR